MYLVITVDNDNNTKLFINCQPVCHTTEGPEKKGELKGFFGSITSVIEKNKEFSVNSSIPLGTVSGVFITLLSFVQICPDVKPYRDQTMFGYVGSLYLLYYRGHTHSSSLMGLCSVQFPRTPVPDDPVSLFPPWKPRVEISTAAR